MTTSRNPVSVLDRIYLPQSAVVLSSVTINEGDLVFWDGTNSTLQPLTTAAQVAIGGSNNSQGFMGVAGGANNPAVYGGDPTLVALPVICRGCVFMFTTNAEVYNHYDLVTVGADSQTVTKSGANSGNAIGAAIIDPPATARASQATPTPETLTGAAGVFLRVQLLPKHVVAAAV